MNRFRKHISFYMVLLMAAPVFVSISLSLYTLFLQHEMKEKLEYAQLQKITIKKDQVQWNILGDEIEMNGQYFDVKDQMDLGDSLVFYGLFDREETALQQKIERQHNHSSKQQALITIAQFLQSVQFLSNMNIAYADAGSSSFHHTLKSLNTDLISPFVESLSKPPERFLFS